MADKSIIPHLKSCCLALGLTEKGKSEPFVISGTGFFIDPEGYFITADHVANGMQNVKTLYKEQGIELEYRGFVLDENETSGQLLAIKIGHGRNIQINIPGLNDFLPSEHDIMMGKISGKYNLPFLKFDKPTKIEVFDEIFICGFPGGDYSMRTQDQIYGNRFSPVLQYGRIASLLPADKSQNPFGIQTDIIGTGGSSGSPIVNAETEQVLGIAQQVIPASVNVNIGKTNASAKIGLIWGISNYFITDAITKMLEKLKTEFDKDGNPLPSDQIPYGVSMTDTFYPAKF